MYNQSSILIVTALLLAMLAAMEIGFRFGLRKQAVATAPVRTQVDGVLAAMLGLLALLLGFTYSLALQRFDDRSRAVVAEANAIGTSFLRIQLLPQEVRGPMQEGFRQYLEIRLLEGRLSLAESGERELLMRRASQLSTRLWEDAAKVAERDVRPVTGALFVQSLNELIDAAGTRSAALDRHVPEYVLLLMFLAFVITTTTLGYASGLAGHRVTPPAYALLLLVALVAYLIIDLDRPRRGVIQVSQESMLSLRQLMGATPGPQTVEVPRPPPPQ